MSDDQAERSYRRRRTLIASSVVAGVALALGMSFAAVPLYRMFCQATGYAGTTQVATGASADTGKRTLTVRFDANVAPGLNWSFEPETPSISLKTGTTATVYFHVKNKTDKPTVANARYNVSPDVVGPYFDKIACFCFTEQTLAPHEELDMPVVFFLNPELEGDETMAGVDTVTLSYTFFAPKVSLGAATPTDGTPRPKL
ncbi:cytochrome c oxidase assembly protein [Lichenihabitans sp. PAMC28606]|uniref:cytochrome c oxidase assembly protein n=1 Tax=Lichenihabitans sp. PAMC28606 TaxID=2880932 RepID=UPI001D0A9599|nr:cytochrome c oxidase assembly protein [Lichenihabitans sp. PAMC28606]UDL96107.1 cytochrome c oxidase assembly protein [Lichenihabitans sp. PAMC28606]